MPPPRLPSVVGQSPEVRERLTPDELGELFDPAFYLRHLDVTFDRLGIEPAPVETRRS